MLLRGIAVTAAVLTVAGCRAPASETAPVAPPDAGTTSAAAPSPQAAMLGSTLTVTDRGATAAYTVADLRPVPVDAQIIPARGTMFAVDVTIAAETGTTAYNGFYFVAKAQDGSNIPPAVGAVKPGIDAGELAAGQKLAAHVAFDVASGQSITQVALRDPKGRTLAVWAAG